MKRLFKNLNVYENGENFYKTVVEELKSCEWVKKDSDKFLCESVPPMTFYKMTAIDFSYFEENNINFRYEVIYTKTTGNPYSWEVNFYANEERQYNDYLLVENDDLGLFSKSEEQKEESNWSDVLYNALTQVLQSKSVEDVVDFIDNNFPSISDKVREDCVINLDPSDLDDSLKEDVAREWIEENAADAYDSAIYNMDSCDIKDKIIDYLSDNL